MKTVIDYQGRSYTLPDDIVDQHNQALARHRAVVTRTALRCGPDESCALELRADGCCEVMRCGLHERKNWEGKL